MNRQPAALEPSARSPFAGCAILVTAVLVMVFLIGFSTLTLFRQFNEIAKFTSEKPVPIEVSKIEDQEVALNALAERLEKFRQQLQEDHPSSLEVSVDDLNLAIAAFDSFKELRGTFRVLGIENGKMRIAISFPLNGKPRLTRENEPGWMTSDSRFLNATLIAHPHLSNQEIGVAIDEIHVPGSVVPREFIEQMSPYRIAERYLADPVLGPAMARITRVEVIGEKIFLARNPGENPVGTITNQQVDSASGRFFKVLGIAAAAFLTFTGVVIFLGIRAKSRKAQDS
jgi:hypothetical protein